MWLKYTVPAAVVLAACLNATVASAKPPPPAPPPSLVGPKYVGNSGVMRDGAAGYFTRHDDCAAAFEGASMCTSRMIIEGGFAPGAVIPIVSPEWVNPVMIQLSSTVTVDFSGFRAALDDLNCARWTTNDLSGLALLPFGGSVKFGFADCVDPHVAACCK